VIKEKGSIDETSIEKVGRKIRNSNVMCELVWGHEHDECDCLLNEEVDYDDEILDMRQVRRRHLKLKTAIRPDRARILRGHHILHPSPANADQLADWNGTRSPLQDIASRVMRKAIASP
jgi:hypothetical protein